MELQGPINSLSRVETVGRQDRLIAELVSFGMDKAERGSKVFRRLVVAFEGPEFWRGQLFVLSFSQQCR